MNLKLLFVVTLSLMFSACAVAPKNTEISSQEPQDTKGSLSLDHMDAQFLYLASQQALSNGQPVLAARFLQTLVNKEPEEIEPRFELVEIYLAAGQSKQSQTAKRLMEGIPQPKVEAFKGERLERYQMLYARALVANGEGLQAETLLQSLLQKRPENHQIRLLLVKMNIINGHEKRAHQLLDEGLGQSDDLRLQKTKVQLYLKQKKFKKAEQLLANMQKKYPEHEDIVLDRALLAEQQQDVTKSERLLQRFIKSHQDTAVQSYSSLAGLYVRQNRLDEAINTYQLMLPLTSGSVDVYTSMGKIYYQQQNYLEAVNVFKTALERSKPQMESEQLNEEQALAAFYLGASLEASHQWRKAMPYYQRLISKHTLYLDAQIRLVSIDIMQKNYDDAEARIEVLVESFEDEISVYEVLSSLRLKQKAYDKLIQETEKALDLGFSQALLFNRAIAFETLKKFVKLDETLSLILQVEPEHSEALNFYGYSLADRGERLEEAFVLVSKALNIRPDDGYYLDSLAWVYFKQKQYVKAIEYQNRAVELVPADPVMQEHLGDMYWSANEFENARKHWKKAIELKHDSPNKVKEKIQRGLQ